jgi:RsmE family RNA methyltransferase
MRIPPSVMLAIQVNLILLEPGELNGSATVTLSGARARHVIAVLGVTPGQEIRVGVLDGPSGVGRVTAVGDGTVELACGFESPIPPLPPVDLLLAVPRPKVLRRLWAQLAALGVGRIMLTNAERVERQYFDTHVVTPACYRPLLVEGLQQARDTRLPIVTVHRQFKVLVEDELDGFFPRGLRLVMHPGAEQRIAAIVKGPDAHRVLLAVGPEGGWNAFEMKLLHAHGFTAATLGARTLRSDTACIAILAVVHEAMRG